MKPSTILDYVATFVCDRCHKPGHPSPWLFRGERDERLCTRCEAALRWSIGVFKHEATKVFSER